jgi:hypothetical protein
LIPNYEFIDKLRNFLRKPNKNGTGESNKGNKVSGRLKING